MLFCTPHAQQTPKSRSFVPEIFLVYTEFAANPETPLICQVEAYITSPDHPHLKELLEILAWFEDWRQGIAALPGSEHSPALKRSYFLPDQCWYASHQLVPSMRKCRLGEQKLRGGSGHGSLMRLNGGGARAGLISSPWSWASCSAAKRICANTQILIQ
jgi:hypothetical protein